MVATAIGLPLAMWIERYWLACQLLGCCGSGIGIGLGGAVYDPILAQNGIGRHSWRVCRLQESPSMVAYATSMLIIGATFAAFSYFSPILTDLTGFGAQAVPILLGVYGVATVLGNMVTGRLADHYMMQILTIGLVALAAALVVFGLFVHSQVIAMIAVVIVGLAGVPMNPAMATRVTRVADTRSLVDGAWVRDQPWRCRWFLRWRDGDGCGIWLGIASVGRGVLGCSRFAVLTASRAR